MSRTLPARPTVSQEPDGPNGRRIALLVTDGVGARNFLQGRFLDLLAERASVVVAQPETAAAAPGLPSPIRFETLPAAPESALERVLREAKIYAQLYANYRRDAADVILRFRRPSGSWRARGAAHLAHLLGRLSGSVAGTARLDRWHASSVRRSPHLAGVRARLEAMRPSLLFCTHQRASVAVPAMAAARDLGIPTAVFIFSWDNLPKGRMAVHADHYLLWSERMRRDLLHYYPEVGAARTHVVGTPQFEPYFDRELRRPRAAFLGELGLDPGRPVVCFSGDDEATSPRDPSYLEDLAAGLRHLPAAERPQILLRRCPTDWSGRFRPVLERYDGIAVCEPAWHRPSEGDWTRVAPLPEDRSRLVNTVAHSDVVVNLGSTMALDFAILDRPAVYVAYDPPGLRPGWTDDLYRLPHFEPVHRLQPVLWAASAEALVPAVRAALERPQEKAAARRSWLTEVAEHPLEEASRRIVATLDRLASPSARREVA